MFTIGADPEMFLVDAADSYVSAVHLIGGSKEHPRPLPLGEGFAVQEDNVAVEYNIPPASNQNELKSYINQVKDYLAREVGGMGLRLSQHSAALFPENQLKTKEAQTFGCDPDYNCWTSKRNPRPKAAQANLRSCGGHVHIGFPFKTKREVATFMKYMDLFLAVPSVLMDQGEMRKELYGKAGAFRFKPYGGEYRTLSNFWTFEDRYIDWVWESTSKAMFAWQQNQFDINDLQDSIVACINNNNRNLAKQLVDHHSLLVV